MIDTTALEQEQEQDPQDPQDPQKPRPVDGLDSLYAKAMGQPMPGDGLDQLAAKAAMLGRPTGGVNLTKAPPQRFGAKGAPSSPGGIPAAQPDASRVGAPPGGHALSIGTQLGAMLDNPLLPTGARAFKPLTEAIDPVLKYGVNPMLENPLQTAVTTPLMFGAGALSGPLGLLARAGMTTQMLQRPAEYAGQKAAEMSLPPDVRAKAEADPDRVTGGEAAVNAAMAGVPMFAEALHRLTKIQKFRYADPTDYRATASGAAKDWSNTDVDNGRAVDIHRETNPARLLGNRLDYGSEKRPTATYTGEPTAPEGPDFTVEEDAGNRAKLTEIERLRAKAKEILEVRRRGATARVVPPEAPAVPPEAPTAPPAAPTTPLRRSIGHAVTGVPFTARLMRGQGRVTTPYNEYVPQEAVLGPGRYTTPDREYANYFGPNVTEHDVSLTNPLVITSDRQWVDLTGRAGWPYANPFGLDEILKREGKPPRAGADIKRLRDIVAADGHDGIVIRVPTDERIGKTLQKVFGADQVVEFSNPEPAAPPPATPAAAPREKNPSPEAPVAPPQRDYTLHPRDRLDELGERAGKLADPTPPPAQEAAPPEPTTHRQSLAAYFAAMQAWEPVAWVDASTKKATRLRDVVGREYDKLSPADQERVNQWLHKRSPPWSGKGRLVPAPPPDKIQDAYRAHVQKYYGLASPPEAPPEAPVATSLVRSEPLANIDVEPERFQYKLNVNEKGVGRELESVKQWNPDLAGVVGVWRDPADGRLKVVNGHHRVDLARRNNIPNIDVREIQAPDAATARATGAVINIAEGRGTAVDAAKLFRDTKTTPTDLERRGVSLTGQVAKDGLALAKLHPTIFADVVAGRMPVQRAAVIGASGLAPEQQLALTSMLDAREAKGRRMSNEAVGELIRFVKAAGSEEVTQDSLFGTEHMQQSLAPEKAELSAFVKDKLSKDRRLFGFLTKGGRAEHIEGSGAGKIETQRAGELATQAAQAEEVYNKLSAMQGPVADALTAAARDWAQGGDKNAIRARLYDAVADAIRATTGSPTGTPHGSPERPGGEGSAPAPPGAQADDDLGLGFGPPGEARSRTPQRPTRAGVDFGHGPPSDVRHRAGDGGPLNDVFNAGNAPRGETRRPTPPEGTKPFAPDEWDDALHKAASLASRAPDTDFQWRDEAERSESVDRLRATADYLSEHPTAPGYGRLAEPQNVEFLRDVADRIDQIPAFDRQGAMRREKNQGTLQDAVAETEGRPGGRLHQPPGESRSRTPRRPGRADVDVGYGPPSGSRRRAGGGGGGGGIPGAGGTGAGRPVPPRGSPPPGHLKAAAVKFLKLGDEVRKLFAADTRSPEAAMTGAVIRQNKGWRDRSDAQARDGMRLFAQAFDRLPEPSRTAPTADVMANPRMAFMHGIELGQTPTGSLPKPSPWLPWSKEPSVAAAATAVRALLDTRRAQVQALNTGALRSFYEHYFPHIWENPTHATSVIAEWYAKRPYEGSKSFLNQRKHMTVEDGIEAGLWPKTTNPIELSLLKAHEMAKYIEAHRSWKEFAQKGLIKYVPAGKKWPDGWAPLNDKMAKIFGGAVGQWVAPEPVAHVFNQHLAPGMRGNGLYNAYMLPANSLNLAQLGLSWFHGGLMVMESSVSDLALAGEQLSHPKITTTTQGNTTITTKRVNVAGLAPLARGLVPGASFVNDIRVGGHIEHAYLDPSSSNAIYRTMAAEVERAGGRIAMDQAWDAGQMRALGKAVRTGKYGEAVARLLPAGWEAAVAPIMRGVVPRVKLAAFGRLALSNIERLGPNPADEAIRFAVQKAWNSIDNRAGQYVYANKFWNPYWKDAMHALVRAPGWTGGTFGELGGGGMDIGRMGVDAWNGKTPSMTSRTWYTAALVLGVAWFGSLLQYMLTGEGPKGIRDLYFPRTGEKNNEGNDERLQLPSYMRDVTSWTHHTGRTAINKLAPAVHAFAELAQNRDFYGDKVFGDHTDESLPGKATDWTKELASYAWNSGVKPFAVRNMQESGKRSQSTGIRALSYLGVTPANRDETRTDAQNRLMNILDEHGHTPAQPDEQAQRRALADTKQGLRAGTAAGTEGFNAQLGAGALSSRSAHSLVRKSMDPVWVERFKQLDIPDAVQVFQLGDSTEKAQWRPELFAKIRNARNAKTIAPADLPLIERALKAAGAPR